jgi:nucleoside 2-deoxyribosyltransferase
LIPNRPNIYLAGPLFSAHERLWNISVRNALNEFCDVYLPQEDGELLVDLIANGMQVEEAKNLIFVSDLRAIERCDILLLVMDGRVIDEGAAFELGYAYSLGKTCIGLKTDVRSLLPVGDNPMVECALRTTFSDLSEVSEWIRHRRWDRH